GTEKCMCKNLCNRLNINLSGFAIKKCFSKHQFASGLEVQSEERHHVVKRSSQPCSDSFDKYCLNKGQCMFLVEVNEHHCKCERGHYGPRCETLELVVQPMGEEQTIAIIFCVCLLIVGVAGALYFCCKWCKKKKFPVQSKRHGYKGVQTA
uniref:EGF-like domain-containing protein n=1 Tax=Gouania willdenowi TaxID=441366 RepID=A0A8C5H161_GOUWI